MKAVRYAVWGIAGFLLLVHACIVAAHTLLVVMWAAAPSSAVAGYWVLIVLGAVLLMAGFWKRRIAGSTTYMLLIALMIVLMGANWAWLAADAPAPTDDYSSEELACPANGSFELLSVFNSKESFLPETPSRDELHDVAADWDAILERRNAIDGLARLDWICSVPEPATFTVETQSLRLRSLIETADIYSQYFLAQVSAGQPREATEALCRLHRVARKGMSNAVLTIHKMFFAVVVRKTIEASWIALQDENIDQQTLITLQKNFTPIEFEEISMVRPLIGEYLFMKNYIRSLEPEILVDSTLPEFVIAQSLNPLRLLVSSVAGFKPNRSLADIKIYYDLLIDANRNPPVDITPAEAYMNAYIENPPIRNMLGWMLNRLVMPNFASIMDRLAAIKIRSALLALALSQRLEQPVSLTDYYTGQELRYRR